MAFDPADPFVQEIVQGTANEILDRFYDLLNQEEPDYLLKSFDQIYPEIMEDAFDRSGASNAQTDEEWEADTMAFEDLVWPLVFAQEPAIKQMFETGDVPPPEPEELEVNDMGVDSGPMPGGPPSGRDPGFTAKTASPWYQHGEQMCEPGRCFVYGLKTDEPPTPEGNCPICENPIAGPPGNFSDFEETNDPNNFEEGFFSKFRVVALGELQQPSAVGATPQPGGEGQVLQDNRPGRDLSDVAGGSADENNAFETWVKFAVEMLNQGKSPEQAQAELAISGCPDVKGVMKQALDQPIKEDPGGYEGAQDPFDVPFQDGQGDQALEDVHNQPPVLTSSWKTAAEWSKPWEEEDDEDDAVDAEMDKCQKCGKEAKDCNCHKESSGKPWETEEDDDDKDDDDGDKKDKKENPFDKKAEWGDQSLLPPDLSGWGRDHLQGIDAGYNEWECPECGSANEGSPNGMSWHDCATCGWSERSPTDLNGRVRG